MATIRNGILDNLKTFMEDASFALSSVTIVRSSVDAEAVDFDNFPFALIFDQGIAYDFMPNHARDMILSPMILWYHKITDANADAFIENFWTQYIADRNLSGLVDDWVINAIEFSEDTEEPNGILEISSTIRRLLKASDI